MQQIMNICCTHMDKSSGIRGDSLASKIYRQCSWPTCSKLVNVGGYCKEHKVIVDERREAAKGERDKQTVRPDYHAWYKTARWVRARRYFLNRNPLCVRCMEVGKLVDASVVDHIIPHKGNPKLFWKQTNWQALCKGCHDRKTAKEDGGFGNQSEAL